MNRYLKRLLPLLFLAILLAPLDASGIVWRADSAVAKTPPVGEMRQVGKLLYSPLRILGGTCVAIGGEWVLTSRHGTDKWWPAFLKVSFPALDNSVYQIEQIVPCDDGDLALLRLDKPVSGAKSLRLHNGDDEAGKRAWLGGFGLSGPVGGVSGNGKFHAGHNRVEQVRKNKITIVLNRPSDIGVEPDEAILTLLDSGSPLFVEARTGWQLAGIGSTASSRMDPNYGARGSYARVSAVHGWILGVVKQDQRPEAD